MNVIPRTEEATEKLLKHRFPDDFILDDACFALQRAKGMIGLIGDVACMGMGPAPYHEVNLNNIERTAKEAEMNIKDAIIMIEDLCNTRMEAERNVAGNFQEVKTPEEAVN